MAWLGLLVWTVQFTSVLGEGEEADRHTTVPCAPTTMGLKPGTANLEVATVLLALLL